MPDELTYNKKLDIYIARSHGDVSREDILATLSSLNSMRKPGKLIKLLVDATEQRSAPSIISFHGLAEVLPVSSDFKAAIISLPGSDTHEQQVFFETASSNRAKNIRLFQNRDEAIAWLTGE